MPSTPRPGPRAVAIGGRDLVRGLGRQLRELRVDAGVTQAALARAANVDDGHLSRIEAGIATPSLDALVALGLALGSDLSVRFFPGSGPRLRDRFQAPMVEAILRLLDRRWVQGPKCL